MGLDNSSIRYHFHLKQTGASFERVAMLGRQQLFGVTRNDLVRSAGKFGFKMTLKEADDILKFDNGYAEGFYKWLGATVVDSFDASNYESATQIWDMNGPLPESHRGGYDFVFDGGTLEHVFNYPSALREALTLPASGGIFFSATPSDSYLGHGFYQFGPDLAFEVLTARNGYRNLGVYLVEQHANPVFYQIAPPESGRGRTLVSTSNPTQMLWCGERISEVPGFLTAYQPDYSSAWISAESPESSRIHPLRTIALSVSGWIPGRLRIALLRTSKQLVNIAVQNSFWDRTWAKRTEKI